MKVVDLHGVIHEDVETVLDHACRTYEAPFYVITGHSTRMKELVSIYVTSRGFIACPAIGNQGRLVINEK